MILPFSVKHKYFLPSSARITPRRFKFGKPRSLNLWPCFFFSPSLFLGSSEMWIEVTLTFKNRGIQQKVICLILPFVCAFKKLGMIWVWYFDSDVLEFFRNCVLGFLSTCCVYDANVDFLPILRSSLSQEAQAMRTTVAATQVDTQATDKGNNTENIVNWIFCNDDKWILRDFSTSVNCWMFAFVS